MSQRQTPIVLDIEPENRLHAFMVWIKIHVYLLVTLRVKLQLTCSSVELGLLCAGFLGTTAFTKACTCV